MGEAYRGLTIRFAADGTKVMSTLKAMRRAGADVESELRLVNRALKFDGANTTSIAKQMKLMAERTGTAGAEAIQLRKQLDLLGKEEIGGKKMRELSKETKDASTQASLMRERYNSATESLARLQNEAEELWRTSRLLKNVPNPFLGWNDMSTEQLQSFMKILRNTGSIGQEQFKRMHGAVRSLREEFNFAGDELKKLNHIAEYQSAENKLLQLEASAKRYRNALRDAALQERETGHEFNLGRVNASLERASSNARQLKEAMKLNPKSYEAALGHTKALKAEMEAVEAETRALRAEIGQLEAKEGVRELAADASRLGQEFRESGMRVSELSEKLGVARAKMDSFQQEADQARTALKAAGDAPTKELVQNLDQAELKLSQARKEADFLQKEFDQAAAAAEKVNAALKVTDNRSQIAANNAKMQAMSQNQAKKSLMSTSAMTSLGMSMYATVYPAAMMAGSYAIQAAQEVDSAYRDMRKTVQGTEADFENLKQKALEFGDTHVTSADQILEFEAMGGQLGITADNLEAFSTTVANLDIATNIDADEVAIELGKMASILQISSDEYDNFADSLVRLGNSEPALESDIMAITARFGAMAHIVGMTPDQILAIATAATATGQKAEAAGGALQRLLGGIETKVSGVSDAMRNLDGLTEEDLAEFEGAKDNLEAFANVAGMSAEQFAQAWEYDAAGAFQKFIEGLKKYGEEGGSVQALLYDELGYHNIRDLQLLQGLTNTTQVMTDSLKMSANAYKGISDQWGAAGDAAREADKKAQGFSGQLQILKNNGQHMADMLGESLLPAMQQLTGMASDGVKFFENMGDGAKMFTLGLVGLAVALGPSLTMMAAGRNAINSFKTSIAEYTSVQSTMDRLNGSYIARQKGLNTAYARNGEIIARNTARMREIESVQSKLNTSTMLGATASRAYSKEYAKLGQETKKAQKMNKLITAGGGAMGALKSVGAMAGIGLGMVAIEQIIAKLIDMKEQADDVRDATEGIGKVTESIRFADFDQANGIKDMGKSLEDLGQRFRDVTKSADEFIKSNADFARSAQGTMDETNKSAVKAEYWSDKVIELSGNFDGSASSLAELKNAVEQYNEVTGGNLAVVDDLTGRLNMNTDAIRLNTEAFKQAIMVKAFSDVAEEAAKKVAEGTAELDSQKQALEELQAQHRADPPADQATALQYASEEQALKDKIATTEKAIAEDEKLADAAFDRAEQQRVTAEETAKAAEKEREATHSAEAYSKALEKAGESGDAFTQLGEQLGVPQDSLDQFAASLADSGIGIDQLASVGSEAFARLYQSANGDLEKLSKSINSIKDGMDLLGKSNKLNMGDVTINDDATLNVKNHLLDLQNQKIDGKSFTITDNGTIDAVDQKTRDLLAELGILGATVATPTVNVNDNASGTISSILSSLRLADGFRAVSSIITQHISKYSSEGQQASGGINNTLLRQIPTHADGGMTGIVTRATLTNQGWVGEDGAEALLRMGRQTAVVPLTNTRYVRPFARAVASEMPGMSSSSVTHNHYSVGNLTVAEGSGAARAMEMLVHELKIARSA